MATKADFTPEEWQTLIQAPLAIGTLITMSSPAIGDAFKESMAVAKKLGEVASATGNTELMASISDEYKDRATAKAAQVKADSPRSGRGQSADARHRRASRRRNRCQSIA